MKKYALPVLLLVSLMFVSCIETTGKGNLHIVLESPQTRSIRPDNRSGLIVKYNVKGVGPGGKTFSRDSTSKSITVEGLTMGTWTITATGYNADSIGIVSGAKTFEFKSGVKQVSISLASYSGTGSVQIDFSWDKEVSNPKLVIDLEQNGKTESEIYAPSGKSNTYKFIKDGLAAGTYILKANLYNGDTHMTGSAEAVQVVNNKTTSGSVSLTSPSGSSDNSTLDSPFYAHLAVPGQKKIPDTFEANKENKIIAVPDSSFNSSIDYKYEWYMDGELKSREKEFVFSPKSGSHIVSVIVTNPSDNSSGSMYCKFNAKISAKKGSATFVTKVKSSENTLALASDSILGALPGGNFLLVTPSRSTMQVFSVFNNSVILTANQTYNATDVRFSWLSKVSSCYSNSLMNFVAVITESNYMHGLLFNPNSGKLELATWYDEPLAFGDGFVSVPPSFVDNITSVALIPSSSNAGTVFVFDSGSRSEEVISISCSDNEINTLGTSVKDSDTGTTYCSAGSGGFLVAVTDGGLKFAKTQNGVISSVWNTYKDENLANVRSVHFLNQRFVLFETPSDLRIYEYYSQQKIWVGRTLINTVPTCCSTSDDGAYIYLSDRDGNIVSYRSGLTDNFGKIYSQAIDEPLTQIVTNGNHIVGSDSNGNLYIFEIIPEDTQI